MFLTVAKLCSVAFHCCERSSIATSNAVQHTWGAVALLTDPSNKGLLNPRTAPKSINLLRAFFVRTRWERENGGGSKAKISWVIKRTGCLKMGSDLGGFLTLSNPSSLQTLLRLQEIWNKRSSLETEEQPWQPKHKLNAELSDCSTPWLQYSLTEGFSFRSQMKF